METPGECGGWSAAVHWVGFGQPEIPAMAIVAMNPWNLWTPLLWERRIFVSCTVCTFTLIIQWQQPHLLHLGGPIWESTIYRNKFHQFSCGGRATIGEVSPIQIAAMKKCLQCWQRHWHRYKLDYRSICNSTPNCNHLLRFSIASPHRPGDTFPIWTLILTLATTGLLDHPPLYNSLWVLPFKKNWRSTAPLCLLSGS